MRGKRLSLAGRWSSGRDRRPGGRHDLLELRRAHPGPGNRAVWDVPGGGEPDLGRHVACRAGPAAHPPLLVLRGQAAELGYELVSPRGRPLRPRGHRVPAPQRRRGVHPAAAPRGRPGTAGPLAPRGDEAASLDEAYGTETAGTRGATQATRRLASASSSGIPPSRGCRPPGPPPCPPPCP